MGARQDALDGGERDGARSSSVTAKRIAGLVGTVGKMSVLPGAINVIPQDVAFTIDVRSGDDALAPRGGRGDPRGLRGDRRATRRRRRRVAEFFTANAAPCDPALQDAFARAIAAHGIPVRHLPSGAGHDAMEFPAVAPTAMLFVRCGNNGISHHPDETMTAEDADIATSVLLHFFENYRPAHGYASTSWAAGSTPIMPSRSNSCARSSACRPTRRPATTRRRRKRPRNC